MTQEQQNKALSIRQPFAWLISHGIKTIENRSWSTKIRGKILIHAAKILDPDDAAIRAEVWQQFGVTIPPDLPTGGFVGTVHVIDCVVTHPSYWFQGPFGFLLERARPARFRAARGQLGFFTAT